jgi:hypothetical protein
MISVDKIRWRIQSYLDDNVTGSDLINCIDDAVSSDDVYKFSQQEQNIIMKYQDLLALYVEDPVKRQESSAYYGPDRLRDIVMNFRRELANLDRNTGRGISQQGEPD